MFLVPFHPPTPDAIGRRKGDRVQTPFRIQGRSRLQVVEIEIVAEEREFVKSSLPSKSPPSVKFTQRANSFLGRFLVEQQFK
jgi:hypothetical protein